MVRTTLLFVTLFLGTALVKARHPSMSGLRGTPSYSCNKKYLVTGRDFVTCEMEVSGNNSDYTYNYHQSPRFQLQELIVEKEYSTVISDTLICEPFTTPQEGFCVNRDIVSTTGCSCEVVGHQIYRVKVVYRITDVYRVRRRIRLQWPSTTAGDIGVFYDLPEARVLSHFDYISIRGDKNISVVKTGDRNAVISNLRVIYFVVQKERCRKCNNNKGTT
ncbi:hypothetical protein PoB_000405200 [Plakobranchus ocellatus]|uniref:Uncharacterized protein n=1 Tax=Plakobranchus ocellatus TaxID=259542 RepID=A0AAV3Y532_9GAST|nr:hypothetical protein PoB_000405200 [Plakobranchus ocellatus]